MPTDSLYVLAVLCLIVVVSEVLVRRTLLRHLGTALLVILVTAVAANVGMLPAGSTEEAPVPAYDAIFAYVAPVAIFWILLRVNLREVMKAGVPLVLLFLIGAAGTVVGVLAGMWVINGPASIGPSYYAVAGMFAGTYTGGSINFNAVALHYEVVRDGVLYTGSVVVDNIVTTIWMVATLAIPRVLAPLWPHEPTDERGARANEPDLGIEDDTEAIHPIDLGLVLFLGLGALWVSNAVAAFAADRGVTLPSILVITVIALAFAQSNVIARLRGAQTLGMFAVYLFLAVIGAFCDVRALGSLGRLGVALLVFATVVVAVHAVFTLVSARMMKLDLDLVAVASQANVGGSTSALALARSLGRQDLVLPAVLLGSLGNAIGTFLGFWAARMLPWLV